MMSMVELVVMRCTVCGDTFPLHAEDRRLCPSCASDQLVDATEPLL